MRPALWNIERGLINDDTVTDPIELQSRLFQEELQETLKAIKENNLVEIVDGYCDMRFVWEGGVAKYKLNYINDWTEILSDGFNISVSPAYKALLDIQKEQLDYVEQLVFNILQKSRTSSIEDVSIFQMIFGKPYFTTSMTMEQCYNIVCNANDKKSKEKINGKIAKGENFVSPNEAIKQLLKDRGYKL